MKEVIENAVTELSKRYGFGLDDLVKIKSVLIKHLTGLPLDPSQFVNGEPEEDGEYVVIFQDGEEKMYMCIEYCTTDTYRFAILSHAKLPE